MDELFLKILNMSITATYVMIAVLFLRLILKRAPKRISYALWSLVLFRLVCPVSISSAFSVFGRIGTPASLEFIPGNIGMMSVPQVDIGTASMNSAINNALPVATPAASANPMQLMILIGACVWLAGFTLMLIYSVVSYLRLEHRMMDATLVSGNIFETDKISSPFVCGLIKPKIYLPVGLTGNDREYVLRHEQTHIARKDHLIKPIAFLVLSVHWFNPFMWIAFILMSRDLEMSCDEKVVSGLDSEGKVGYSSALIQLAMKRPILAGSPLAFGESGTKERIKNVLNYKKPAFWILIAVFVIVITAGFSLLTDPVSKAALETENEDTTQPWVGVPQKTDWPTRDMTFDRITFGSDRDLIIYRFGREPDSENALADGSKVLTYHEPPVKRNGEDMPGTETDVTFYLNGTGGVYRIDVYGSCEMTGRESSDGTLAGVLTQYGGPNDVESDGDVYTLWYYSPENPYQRLWFEVKDGELTKRMGIVEFAKPAATQGITELANENGVFTTSWDRLRAYGAPDMSADESEMWQQRLQNDISGVTSYQVGGVYSKDFDVNGINDLTVLLYAVDGQSSQAYLCVYMNDDPIYTETFSGMPVFGFMQYPICGDIDNDGYPEIVYNIFTGGNGGAGSSVKGVLKYDEHELIPMELPGDDSEDFTGNNDVGYQVKVLFGKGENEYKAVCDGLGKTVDFQAQNAVYENGTKFRSYITENEEVGGNSRGYASFSIVNRGGRNYLLAEEYLYGEAGPPHGVGFATFLIQWDGSGKPFVSEFGVSDKSVRSEEESSMS